FRSACEFRLLPMAKTCFDQSLGSWSSTERLTYVANRRVPRPGTAYLASKDQLCQSAWLASVVRSFGAESRRHFDRVIGRAAASPDPRAETGLTDCQIT